MNQQEDFILNSSQQEAVQATEGYVLTFRLK